MKLTYSEAWTNSGTATYSPFVRQFRGDSIYDPDFDFAPQPSARAFQLYTAQYNRWTVLGSAIKVSFINESGGVVSVSNGTPSYSAAHPRTVAVLPGKFQESDLLALGYNGIRALPYITQRNLTPLQGSRSMCTISKFMTTAKILGIPRMTPLVNDNYTGVGTTDPVVIWYWSIIFEKGGDTDYMSVDYQTDVTYYVKFWDKKITPA